MAKSSQKKMAPRSRVKILYDHDLYFHDGDDQECDCHVCENPTFWSDKGRRGDYDQLITIIINMYLIILTLPCEHMTLLNGATTSKEGDGKYNCAQSCQKDRGAQEAMAEIGHF